MADSIVFRYQAMATAANDIRNTVAEYEKAFDTLVNAFKTATTAWEGASKDAMTNYINTKFSVFATEDIPAYIRALGDMLDGNAAEMKRVDDAVAANIIGNGK